MNEPNNHDETVTPIEAFRSKHPELGEPPPTSRPLAEILDDIEAFLRRFVVFPSPHAATAAALWVAHTWTAEAAEVSPYLSITSPEKRSGKSRLLDCLELLVARPWRAVLPSEAVLFRKIESDKPTLLLDEVDPIFNSRGNGGDYEPLRAILNAGFQRGTKVPRCLMSGRSVELIEFEVFCPKALAGIGELPDTVADRSIPIRMQRRSSNERVERFRRREAPPFALPIREALAEWSESAVESLSRARPELVEGISDRAADCWEPLIALAESAGPDWANRARIAAAALHGSNTVDDETLGIRLLADTADIFETKGVDRISSEDYIAALVAIEEAPWGDLRGRPVSARFIAKLLRDYGVRPAPIRFGDKLARGYLLEAFKDVFPRYVPNSRNTVTPQVDGPFHPKHEDPSVTPRTASDQASYVVTDKTPSKGQGAVWGGSGGVVEAVPDVPSAPPSTAAEIIVDARNKGHSDKAIAAALNVAKIRPPKEAEAWSAFIVGQVVPA